MIFFWLGLCVGKLVTEITSVTAFRALLFYVTRLHVTKQYF